MNFVFSVSEGLEDVSYYPNIFAALIEDDSATWSDEDLGKLASGNIIRVLEEVESASGLLNDEEIYQAWIPEEDIFANETTCAS